MGLRVNAKQVCHHAIPSLHPICRHIMPAILRRQIECNDHEMNRVYEYANPVTHANSQLKSPQPQLH